MEKLNIYGIFDKKSERFDTPFFAYSDLFAERRFRLMLAEKNSVLNTWPDEFVLFRLGEVDLITGMIKDKKALVIEGKQIPKEQLTNNE